MLGSLFQSREYGKYLFGGLFGKYLLCIVFFAFFGILLLFSNPVVFGTHVPQNVCQGSAVLTNGVC